MSLSRYYLLWPICWLVRYGSRSFATSGPSLWNSLPLTVRDLTVTFAGFCSRLKTELYSLTERMVDTQHPRDRLLRGGGHPLIHSIIHGGTLTRRTRFYIAAFFNLV